MIKTEYSIIPSVQNSLILYYSELKTGGLTINNKHKNIINQFWEELNQHNTAIIDTLCSDQISSFSYGISRAYTNNIIEYKNEFLELFKAFPDYYLEIYKIVAEGSEVWVYGMQKATQSNPFFGIPATNKKFEIAKFIIYELNNAKIVKETILTDTLKLYKNLGQAIMKSQNQEQTELYLKHLMEIGLIPK